MAHSGLASLRKKFGNECHYCGDKTNGTKRDPKQATREHVVPKAYGGENNINNYVLACAECNNERGTQLFYCECEAVCGPLIRKALANDHFVRIVFDGLIEHNKFKVYKQGSLWVVKVYHGRKHFPTWDEAMGFAMNYEGRAVR